MGNTYFDESGSSGKRGKTRTLKMRARGIKKDELDDVFGALTLAGAQQVHVGNKGRQNDGPRSNDGPTPGGASPKDNEPITESMVLSYKLWGGTVDTKKGGATKVAIYAYADIVTKWSGLTGFLKVQLPKTTGENDMIVMNLHNAKFTTGMASDYQVRIENTYYDATSQDGKSRTLTMRARGISKGELDDVIGALTLAGAQHVYGGNKGNN